MQLDLKRRLMAWKNRGTRAEFWLCVLGSSVATIAVRAVLNEVGLASLWPPLSIVTLPIWLFIASRRLHDFGARAQWGLLPFAMGFVLGFLRAFMRKQGVAHFMEEPIWPATINLISLVEVIVVGAWPGNPDDNRFGPPPGRRDSAAVASEFS